MQKEQQKGEIVGFEYWDFEEYEKYVWNPKTWKWEGKGTKLSRKYRRCAKASIEDEWKVTTNFVPKRSMWATLRGYYRSMGLQQGKEPWREDFRILLHTIDRLEAEGKGLYQGRYGRHSYDRGSWKWQDENRELQDEQDDKAQERKAWTGEEDDEEVEKEPTYEAGHGDRLVQCPCGTWHASKTHLEEHQYKCHVCKQEYHFVQRPPKGCRQPVMQLRRQGQNLKHGVQGGAERARCGQVGGVGRKVPVVAGYFQRA